MKHRFEDEFVDKNIKFDAILNVNRRITDKCNFLNFVSGDFVFNELADEIGGQAIGHRGHGGFHFAKLALNGAGHTFRFSFTKLA